MDTKQHFLRNFAYDYWANRECLSALSAASPAPPKVLRLIAHTLSAQMLWLERLQRVPQSVAVWPSSTLEDCGALADEMLSAWKEDVLTHVLMHSAYHRGQVALEMRSAGLQPAYTDFIHGVRQGFVE